MGVPAGHPFFGNQYTNGGYIRGTYTYEWIEKGKEIIKPLINEVSQTFPHVASKQKLDSLIPKELFAKSFNKITNFINSDSIVAIAVGVFIIDLLLRNNAKEKQESLLSIELLNIGTCVHCGEPLTDSTYVPEGAEVTHKAYILCKKCGEKNYARFPDENGVEASNADE